MKTCKNNNGIAAFATKTLNSVAGLPKNSRENPTDPIGQQQGIYTFVWCNICCYTGQGLFRNGKQIPAPYSTQQCPHPQIWDPPVPVWVGVHSPSDGDEQPRDESCLQGQLKGHFLGDNRHLVSAKNHLKSPMPPLGTASPRPLLWPSKISP